MENIYSKLDRELCKGRIIEMDYLNARYTSWKRCNYGSSLGTQCAGARRTHAL